jgi:hypothetical protein
MNELFITITRRVNRRLHLWIYATWLQMLYSVRSNLMWFTLSLSLPNAIRSERHTKSAPRDRQSTKERDFDTFCCDYSCAILWKKRLEQCGKTLPGVSLSMMNGAIEWHATHMSHKSTFTHFTRTKLWNFSIAMKYGIFIERGTLVC